MDVEPDQLKESPVDMVGVAVLHAFHTCADGHEAGDQADEAVGEPRGSQAARGLDQGLWPGGLAALCLCAEHMRAGHKFTCGNGSVCAARGAVNGGKWHNII